MSTRCAIQIQQGNEITASLYRHWDGYLAETGADLVQAVIKAGTNPSALVLDLLSTTYPPTSYDPKPRPMYHIEGIPGDIEHYYRVQYAENSVTIAHAWHDWSDSCPEAEELPALAITFPIPEFVRLVNNDRRAINGRIVARGLDPSGQYEMLEVPDYIPAYQVRDVAMLDNTEAIVARSYYPAAIAQH